MAWFILLLAYHRRERSEYAELLQRIEATTHASKFAERGEVDEMAQSMAQYVAEQAEARGEARGRQAALRSALLTVLTARFGELGLETVTAVETADGDHLNRWLPLAAAAENLTAVGILPTD